MEAATADLDVRPGFVGDVMAGGRRRHTRKLLSVTAAIALVAGVITGVVLTRHPSDPLLTHDERLTAATSGDLASSRTDIEQALRVWQSTQKAPDRITDFSAPAHVFWAGRTPSGPAVLIVQPVRVASTPTPMTLVGLVATNEVVDRELLLDGERERGIYRFGADQSTNVVLTLRRTVYWSQQPVRGEDGRLSRKWWALETGGTGVAVVSTPQENKPVFVRSDTQPADDDFLQEPLMAKQDYGPEGAFKPHTGLGWNDSVWASDKQDEHPQTKSMFSLRDMQRAGVLDYLVADGAFGQWQVRAWLPDGRFASVFEANGETYAAIYRANGTFSQGVAGSRTSKGARLPARVRLPDDLGTVVADFGFRIGPDRRPDAWIAPAGTTSVAVGLADGDSVQVPI
ncbi:hypothetical protein UK23_20200 [Lentzea aerocolonigenes]|uniref:Uncharacterized protein n=2 Tax=Lentzea aerocolonigenes TaxID=68170 RepID=A0A0F0GZQ3_LENAE|nr:hypothetical protein UK23_20200 [Lentzea aerocolonigenes]